MACQRATGECWMYFFRGLFLEINRLTPLHINSSGAAHIWSSETCCLFKMEKDLFLSQLVFGWLCKLWPVSVISLMCARLSPWTDACWFLSFALQSDSWRGHVTRRQGSRTPRCGGTWSSSSAGCANTPMVAAVWASNFMISGGSGCRNPTKHATR